MQGWCFKRAVMKSSRSLGHFVLLLFLFVSVPRVARAQDDSSATPQSGSSSGVPAAEPTTEPVWNPLDAQTTTSSLDTGQTIEQADSVRVSPLHWGHLMFMSADVFYGYDSNYK